MSAERARVKAEAYAAGAESMRPLVASMEKKLGALDERLTTLQVRRRFAVPHAAGVVGAVVAVAMVGLIHPVRSLCCMVLATAHACMRGTGKALVLECTHMPNASLMPLCCGGWVPSRS